MDNNYLPKIRIEELINNILKISKTDFVNTVGMTSNEINRLGTKASGQNNIRQLSRDKAIEIRRKYHDSHGVTLDWLYGLSDKLDLPNENMVPYEKYHELLIQLMELSAQKDFE